MKRRSGKPSSGWFSDLTLTHEGVTRRQEAVTSTHVCQIPKLYRKDSVLTQGSRHYRKYSILTYGSRHYRKYSILTYGSRHYRKYSILTYGSRHYRKYSILTCGSRHYRKYSILTRGCDVQTRRRTCRMAWTRGAKTERQSEAVSFLLLLTGLTLLSLAWY